MALDKMVEEPVLDVLERHRVNVLSEEIGWIDRGSAVTVIVDPVDGTANAAAGVPLASFSAALAIDGTLVEGLAVWLDTGRSWWASSSERSGPTVTGCRSLDGASIAMLRPRPSTMDAWFRLASRAERVRVLGTSVSRPAWSPTERSTPFVTPAATCTASSIWPRRSLVIEAAGGYMCDLRGRPLTLEPDLTLRWSGIVAATRELAEEIAASVLAVPATTGA